MDRYAQFYPIRPPGVVRLLFRGLAVDGHCLLALDHRHSYRVSPGGCCGLLVRLALGPTRRENSAARPHVESELEVAPTWQMLHSCILPLRHACPWRRRQCIEAVSPAGSVSG